MNFNKLKYSKKIAYTVLIAYVMLFLSSIIHHHYIKINSENSFKVSNNFDNSNHFSIYNEFNCPIHNYFNSLHNFSGLKLNFDIIISPQIYRNKFIPDYKKSEFYYQSNPLRAPPIIFS